MLYMFKAVDIVWRCGLCVRFAGCKTSRQPDTYHLYNSWAPDDGHNGARNML